MVYLTYILDNYDSLPDYMVFIHGHSRAWHQPEPIPMKLTSLNFTALDLEHYINLRCTTNPGCDETTFIDATHVHDGESRIQAKLMPGFWRTMFPESLSYWGMGPPPSAIGVPCCAQFALTRAAVQLRPKEFYRMYRRPLERDLHEYKNSIGEGLDSYTVGILYEKTWHMVFGKDSVHCPAQEYCHQTQWSDNVTCDYYPELFEDSGGWEKINCWFKDNRTGSGTG